MWAYVCVLARVCVCEYDFYLFLFPSYPSGPPSWCWHQLHAIVWPHLLKLPKKARDVGLTCRCHLSNIIPDSFFYDSMLQGLTCLFFCFICFLGAFFVCFYLVFLFICLNIYFFFSKECNHNFSKIRKDGCCVLPL